MSISNRLMALSHNPTPSAIRLRELADEVRHLEAENARLKQEVDLLIRGEIVKAKAEKASKS